jgi:alternate signal-mediated exported protein
MKKKIMNKKPIIFLIALLFISVIGVTYSYLYSEVILPNEFKTMTYKVDIDEEFNDTWGTKKVSFVNSESTNTPVVLRVNFSEKWRKTVDGETLTLSNTINGENVVTKSWTNAFLNDFVKKEDGWYYYKKILNGSSSVQVLNSISLNETLISASSNYQDYHTYKYSLIFNFEAVQATENAVSSIWNKNITINGSDVTWS